MVDRSASHIELRRDLQVEIFLGTIATALALFGMIFDAGEAGRALWLAAALCFGTATVGVWFAKEWARWMFGVLAAVVAVMSAGTLIMNFPVRMPVARVGLTMLCGWGAVHMLLPQTRRRFAIARDSISRASGRTE